MSNADEIIKLKKLLDDGIITNEEFEKEKNKILGTDTTNIEDDNTTIFKQNPAKTKISNNKTLYIVGIVVSIILLIGTMHITPIAPFVCLLSLIFIIYCAYKIDQINKNNYTNTNLKVKSTSQQPQSQQYIHSNSETKTNIKLTSNQKTKKSHPILAILSIPIILMFAGFFISSVVPKNPNYKTTQQSNNEKLLSQYSVSYIEFDNIIKKCGYTNYTVEYVGEENNIYYFIVRENNTPCSVNISNGSIISVDYAEHKLYENGQFLNTINDFILTDNEKYNYIDSAREAVKTKLNYPSTAKFTKLYEEYVTYTDKNHINVKGNVTASNAFGVEQTYTYEVSIEDNIITNINLY